MAKLRTHRVVVKVVFDKKVGKSDALRCVRDALLGGFYLTSLKDDDPEEMTVRAVTSVAAGRSALKASQEPA